jgi:hypothetical protein
MLSAYLFDTTTEFSIVPVSRLQGPSHRSARLYHGSKTNRRLTFWTTTPVGRGNVTSLAQSQFDKKRHHWRNQSIISYEQNPKAVTGSRTILTSSCKKEASGSDWLNTEGSARKENCNSPVRNWPRFQLPIDSELAIESLQGPNKDRQGWSARIDTARYPKGSIGPQQVIDWKRHKRIPNIDDLKSSAVWSTVYLNSHWGKRIRRSRESRRSRGSREEDPGKLTSNSETIS